MLKVANPIDPSDAKVRNVVVVALVLLELGCYCVSFVVSSTKATYLP